MSKSKNRNRNRNNRNKTANGMNQKSSQVTEEYIEQFARAAQEQDARIMYGEDSPKDPEAEADAEQGDPEIKTDTEVKDPETDAEQSDPEAETDDESDDIDEGSGIEADKGDEGTDDRPDDGGSGDAAQDGKDGKDSYDYKAQAARNAKKREVSKIKADAEAKERRLIRHKRRVRNQIIAYLSVSIIIIALGVCISFGLHKLATLIADYREEAAEEEYTEENGEAEPAEEIVVTAPEITEPVEEIDTAEEVVEEPTPEDYLEEMVTATISQMPIEDKVAQLFIVSPEALTGVNAATQAGEGTKEALSEYAVGGLIYDRKNIESDEQLTTLLDNTRNMSKYELFLGVNEPGGEQSVLAGSKLTDIPSVESPADIAAAGDSSAAYNAGNTISSYLSFYGINLDLAPNGSVTADEASVSADVSYGGDETKAYEMIPRMIEGLHTGGVNAVMTDFPGTGNITEDTAKGRVESDISQEELSNQILPYITGVTAGARFIQLNNVTYITADSEAMPASLSKYIVDTVLRENMGFEGVIISGPLNETAVTEYYTSDEAALYAYAAGVDMIYMPEDFGAAYESVLNAVKDGTIPESRIDLSLERIFKVKLAGYVE